jgi:hypothetical protein
LPAWATGKRKQRTSPESEIKMAEDTNSSMYGNSGKQKQPAHISSHFMNGHVGSTATWRCGTPDYPSFELNFGASNPVNSQEKAAFKGTNDQPVELSLNNFGHFEYTIKHIKEDGTCVEGGPYCISVAPPPMFYIPPRDCPPIC